MDDQIDLVYGIIIIFTVAVLAICAAKAASKPKAAMTAGLGTINGLAWLNAGPGKTPCWPHEPHHHPHRHGNEYHPDTGDYIGNSSGCAANSMLMGIGA